MSHKNVRIASLALACGLPACTQSVPPNLAPATTDAPASNTQATTSAEPTLYIRGFSVISVYSNGGSTFLRNIPISAYGFAVDTKGYLFDAGSRQEAGYPLDIYANRGAKLVQTIYQRQAFSQPLVDTTGNLFDVCTYGGRVCEYLAARGKNVLRRHIARIIQFNPHRYSGIAQLAVDLKGDLAVVDPPTIAVFPPGEKSPTWSIPTEDYQVTAIAFDRPGNLYVATEENPSVIWVFPPGAKKQARAIIANAAGGNVVSLSFDERDNVYALTRNDQTAAVSVFAPGKRFPSRVITEGLTDKAGSMAVSPSGEVFVSMDSNPGSVVVYASGQKRPLRTIDLLTFPTQIGLGP